VSHDLTTPDQAGTITMPGTGEAFDLTNVDDVLKAGRALAELISQAMSAKKKVDAVARFHMQAESAVRLQRGMYGAVQGTGRAEYHAQAIYDAAIDAGIPQDAVERMIPLERAVRDGRELNKLGTRDDAWAKAIAAGTTRKPGSVKYELERGPAAAPATPEAVKHAVAAERREELAARDRGI